MLPPHLLLLLHQRSSFHIFLQYAFCQESGQICNASQTQLLKSSVFFFLESHNVYYALYKWDEVFFTIVKSIIHNTKTFREGLKVRGRDAIRFILPVLLRLLLD